MRRTRITRGFERLVITTAVIGCCLTAAPVSAAELSVDGFTNGCFGAACMPPDNSASQLTSTPDPAGLSFLNARFDGTTSGGSLELNGAAVFPSSGSQNVDNLGSFFLGTFPTNYNGQSFTLRTSFSAPSSVTDILLTATLVDTAAGFTVDFPNTPVPIVSPDGSFTLTVNDVSGLLRNGNEVAITGRIDVVSSPNNQLPEPSTIALLGIGALGIIRSLARRTRKMAAATRV